MSDGEPEVSTSGMRVIPRHWRWIPFIPEVDTGAHGKQDKKPDKKKAFPRMKFGSWSVIAPLAILLVLALFYLNSFKRETVPDQVAPVEEVTRTEGTTPQAEHEKAAVQKDVEPLSDSLKQHSVEQLLRQAEDALARGNLSLPLKESALFYYQEIERIDPGSQLVTDGKRRISDKYGELAEYEISEKRLSEAMKLIERGLKIFPDSSRLSGVKLRLDAEKLRIINELSEYAEERLRENKLTTPEDDCALKYYREIEAIDRDSLLVSRGLRKIGDRYALLADSAFQRLDFEKSRHYVSEGIGVDPDNARLQRLERELLKSKPEMIMRGVEKKLRSLF